MKDIVFTFEKHGSNIIAFHNEEKDIHVLLEYLPDKRKFKAYSTYTMTKNFVYHGRNYDRAKSGNRELYLKVLRMVNPFLRKVVKERKNIMRERNITRTIVINHITAYVFDKATKAMKESELSVIGDYANNEIRTIVQKMVKDAGAVLADFDIREKETVIRSMSEADFYNNSVTITRGKVNADG